MTKSRKTFFALVMIAVFAATTFLTALLNLRGLSPVAEAEAGAVTNVTDKYSRLAYDENAFGSSVKRLTDAAAQQDYVTLIVSLDVPTVMDAADGVAVADFIGTARYNVAVKEIAESRNAYLRKLKKSGVKYTVDSYYDTLLSGVAVNVKPDDYEKAAAVAEDMGATASVSELYYAPQTVSSTGGSGITENDVNVYETGIFDSSDVKYQGDGVVVAVLDSGFDYTHSAFTSEGCMPNELALTYDKVAERIGGTYAKRYTPSLTAADVYVSDKIPFAYDYGDRDSDVYPLESEHGTHVASIIAGNDYNPETGSGITGVAPRAQLALFKVFSDVSEGARSSWLLNALEDCVAIGVDVINMSLGMSAGFASEEDEKRTDEIYENLRSAGISVIAAASNSYSSTFGSEANGNLPLTSNPDTGTVGTPSTYGAALSVASISGVKTPYLMYEGKPIYYLEAANSASKPYSFMDMMLKGANSGSFEYVTVPGIGDLPSYNGIDVKGKIALVRRGKNTFEEKVQAAYNAGASGVIIYNNVSGDVRMSVGNYLYDWGVGAISMSQDDGERLAAARTGVITISQSNKAGPFMSDFSSWGPGGGLEIKPEITAHGGDILAAVPGGEYDRLSGTSMASPNQAGVHTLVRQYVKQELKKEGTEIAALTNKLIMSTADIAYDEFGNPYAVRRQGAGIANLSNAISTRAYISVPTQDGELDRTKLELGDDPAKSGVYTLKFAVNNLSDTAVSYDVTALTYTEGVSSTLTDKDKTVSSEHAYMLSDTEVKVSGSGVSGTRLTVEGGGKAEVTVTLTLGGAGRDYLDRSFENGMYVEGFAVLRSADGGVNLSAPYLAFYGDWTQAPMFDLTYFETNPDEINVAIDDEDKTKPDAWATRPVGGLYKDFIGYMGCYYWQQNPADVQIPAQEEHIALTNHTDGLNSIYSVWAGLLRGAKTIDVSITDTLTGRTVFTKTEQNVRKSYNVGTMIGYGNVDIKFDVREHNLKNNSQYTVRLDGKLDYGDGGVNTNRRNSYEFTFTTDFEAPKITNVRYYSEYDESTRQTTYYADIDVYDNHYTQALRPMVVTNPESGALKIMSKEFFEPVYGERNSVSTVTIELNEYLENLKGGDDRELIIFCYDYAMNSAAYKINLPQDVTAIAPQEEEITVSENETKLLQPLLKPDDAFDALLDYSSADPTVAKVVNGTLLGVSRGETSVTVSSKTNANVKKVLKVRVLGDGDEGYEYFDRPTVSSFRLLGYNIDFAYYVRYSDEDSVGRTANTVLLDRSRLTMFPGEKITLFYDLQKYFDSVRVEFSSGDSEIAGVNSQGQIRALSEGTVVISASVMDGDSIVASQSVTIEVEDPYVRSGSYLTAYKGLGENNDGVVVIPSRFNLTQISQFAFSLSKSVDRPEDEITEEDPYYTTSGPVGDNDPEYPRPLDCRVTEVVIPEGVELIDRYAFANLTSLKKVYLPKSLKQINAYAFSGCTSLTLVAGLENVKTISHGAFSDCVNLYSTNALRDEFKLDSAIALGESAFRNTAIGKSATGVQITLDLSSVQSAGANAFADCKYLKNVTMGDKIKIASAIFSGCDNMTSININTAVVSQNAFNGCVNLQEVRLGKDVKEIGVGAFKNTAVARFTVDGQNERFLVSADGAQIITKGSVKTLVAVAAGAASDGSFTVTEVDEIGNGAFSHVTGLKTVTLPDSVRVDDYAFYGTELTQVNVEGSGSLGSVGSYAFMNTALTAVPSVSGDVGRYAFAQTAVEAVDLSGSGSVSDYAFFRCEALRQVTLKGGASVGDYAFFGCGLLGVLNADGALADIGSFAFAGTALTAVPEIGGNIGDYAFYRLQIPQVIFGGSDIGDGAFAGNTALNSFTVKSKVASIGVEAFLATRSLHGFTFDGGSFDGVAVGDYAFASAAINGVSVHSAISGFNAFSDASRIGAGAFANSDMSGEADLTRVAQNAADGEPTGANIGAAAFMNTGITNVSINQSYVSAALFSGASGLVYADGLQNAEYIGDEAFFGTALTSARLNGALYIGRLAFADSRLSDVKLGSRLLDLGDNPFAYTPLPLFSVTAVTDDEFKTEYQCFDYDVSDYVKVIGGALYTQVDGGYELISYSAVSGDAVLTVADGTVRVGDYAAAANSTVSTVILPYSLKRIGHAAFADCGNLRTVHFNSIDAPILEAEYNASYVEYESGTVNRWTGEENILNTVASLGLSGSKYATELYQTEPNVLFNNNFIGYIGQRDYGLTMTRPKNGIGYGAYVLDNYFKFKTVTPTVADDATRNVIKLISDLPRASTLTLKDEEMVASVRRAYTQITDPEQAALIQNLDALVAAERRIQTLKDNTVKPDGPKEEPKAPAKNGGNGSTVALVIIVVILGAALIATVTVIILPIIKKRIVGKSYEPDGQEADGKPQEQQDAAATQEADGEQNAAAEENPQADGQEADGGSTDAKTE